MDFYYFVGLVMVLPASALSLPHLRRIRHKTLALARLRSGPLANFSDLAEAGFLSKTNAEALKAAYCAYRDYGHKLILQDERAVIDQSEVMALSEQVGLLWRQIMEA